MKTRNLWLVLGMLVTCQFVSAQGPTYHPGQSVTVAITFEGKDASRVTSLSYVFRLDGADPDSEPQFSAELNSNELNCGNSKLTAPNTVEISCEVPPSQAAGVYHLAELSAIFRDVGNVELPYAEFPARKIKIANSNALIQPKIKDLQVR